MWHKSLNGRNIMTSFMDDNVNIKQNTILSNNEGLKTRSTQNISDVIYMRPFESNNKQKNHI